LGFINIAEVANYSDILWVKTDQLNTCEGFEFGTNLILLFG